MKQRSIVFVLILSILAFAGISSARKNELKGVKGNNKPHLNIYLEGDDGDGLELKYDAPKIDSGGVSQFKVKNNYDGESYFIIISPIDMAAIYEHGLGAKMKFTPPKKSTSEDSVFEENKNWQMEMEWLPFEEIDGEYYPIETAYPSPPFSGFPWFMRPSSLVSDLAVIAMFFIFIGSFIYIYLEYNKEEKEKEELYKCVSCGKIVSLLPSQVMQKYSVSKICYCPETEEYICDECLGHYYLMNTFFETVDKQKMKYQKDPHKTRYTCEICRKGGLDGKEGRWVSMDGNHSICPLCRPYPVKERGSSQALIKPRSLFAPMIYCPQRLVTDNNRPLIWTDYEIGDYQCAHCGKLRKGDYKRWYNPETKYSVCIDCLKPTVCYYYYPYNGKALTWDMTIPKGEPETYVCDISGKEENYTDGRWTSPDGTYNVSPACRPPISLELALYLYDNRIIPTHELDYRTIQEMLEPKFTCAACGKVLSLESRKYISPWTQDEFCDDCYVKLEWFWLYYRILLQWSPKGEWQLVAWNHKVYQESKEKPGYHMRDYALMYAKGDDKYPSNVYTCNICKKTFSCEEGRWSCVESKYDVCPDCMGLFIPVLIRYQQPFNPSQFLIWSYEQPKEAQKTFVCEVCNQTSLYSEGRWYSPHGNYSICANCKRPLEEYVYSIEHNNKLVWEEKYSGYCPCAICDEVQENEGSRWVCKDSDYAICTNCRPKMHMNYRKRELFCPKDTILQHSIDASSPDNPAYCNLCKKKIDELSLFWTNPESNYNVCFNCRPKYPFDFIQDEPVVEEEKSPPTPVSEIPMGDIVKVVTSQQIITEAPGYYEVLPNGNWLWNKLYVIFAIDCSGSMLGERWKSVKTGYRRCLQALCGMKDVICSTYTFDDKPNPFFKEKPPNEALKKVDKLPFTSMGTDYSRAMKWGTHLIDTVSKKYENYLVCLIFLSDGLGGVPAEEIQEIKRIKKRGRKTLFYSISCVTPEGEDQDMIMMATEIGGEHYKIESAASAKYVFNAVLRIGQ